MHNLIRPALTLFSLLSLLTGVLYPLVVTGVAQILFPYTANGSLVYSNGQLLGSTLLGQQFKQPQYFWGRPSATAQFPYNALASGGSNLGPTNPALLTAVRERAMLLRAANPDGHAIIPLELLTASASGLDPHLSPAAAAYQIPRIAKARNLPIATLQQLLTQYTEGLDLGFMGTERINVLRLNLALDAINPAH